MTRNEIEFYNNNVPAIRRALERIADALENNVTQTTKDIPGFEGTLDALDDLCNVTKENEELDTQHDYLHQLVQDLDNSRPEYTWSDWFVGIMTFLLVIPWIGGKVFSKSPWKFDNKK